MKPIISVVTVTLNCARELERTIRSVKAQDYQAIDYVVIDGGSTDGTVEVARSASDIVSTFVSERDRGIYDAMNKGFCAASGDIIGFLNADDEFASAGTLRAVAKAFDDHAVDICYGDLAYAPRKGIVRNRFWRAAAFRPGMFLNGWMPPHPGFFVRRRVYEKLGGFDPRYRISGDYEFMLRALEVEGFRAAYLPQPLVVMAPGGTSNRSIKAIARGNWECLQARRRNGFPARPHLLVWKPLAKLFQLRT